MVSGKGCDWKIERSVVGRLGEVVHSIDSFIVCMFVCGGGGCMCKSMCVCVCVHIMCVCVCVCVVTCGWFYFQVLESPASCGTIHLEH